MTTFTRGAQQATGKRRQQVNRLRLWFARIYANPPRRTLEHRYDHAPALTSSSFVPLTCRQHAAGESISHGRGRPGCHRCESNPDVSFAKSSVAGVRAAALPIIRMILETTEAAGKWLRRP